MTCNTHAHLQRPKPVFLDFNPVLVVEPVGVAAERRDPRAERLVEVRPELRRDRREHRVDDLIHLLGGAAADGDAGHVLVARGERAERDTAVRRVINPDA